MQDLTLYFIKNVTQDSWIGSPLTGAEECDWSEAFAFVSAGDALSVMDQLTRRARANARSLRRRVTGFLTFANQEPDEFRLVPLNLDEPDPDAEGEDDEDETVDAVGEMHHPPSDEDEAVFEDRALETAIERTARERIASIRRRLPGPPLWTWYGPAKDAA